MDGHRHGSRFRNPHHEDIPRGVHNLLLWWLGFYKDAQPLAEVPAGFTYPNSEGHDANQPHATWLNHSTCLIEVDGVTILTDPVWSDRASPVNFVGPRRHQPPPVPLEQLPQIDYVLISHNHYDHLDRATVRALHKIFPDIRWYVPTGLTRWFNRHGIEQVVELDWWESSQEPSTHPLLPHLEFTAVPAQHYSGRLPFDHNRSLWAGWVVRINGKRTLYFVGDTGYNKVHFKEIGDHFGTIDLSLIPIGVYRPTRFMRSVHVDPAEALAIHCDVNSKLSVGTHWGTFKLGGEPMSQPPYDLYTSINERGLSHDAFRVLNPGQTINW